jgi:hypothetical protein
MRAFVKLRQMLGSNEELNRKFAVVIRKLSTHDKYFALPNKQLSGVGGNSLRNRCNLWILIHPQKVAHDSAVAVPMRRSQRK